MMQFQNITTYAEKAWATTLQILEPILSDHVASLTFSSDGKLLASGSGSLMRNSRMNSGIDIPTSISTAESPSMVHAYEISIWDALMSDLLLTLEGHMSSVLSLAFSSRCELLASGSEDGTIKLWSSITGDLQQSFEDHSAAVRSISFSFNDTQFASGSDDKNVRL